MWQAVRTTTGGQRTMKLRTALTALSVAGALIAPATAGAATHTTRYSYGYTTPTHINASVTADAQHNYGLPVTWSTCEATGTQVAFGTLDVAISCILGGPHGFRAIGWGVILPTGQPGMVYAPAASAR